MDPRHHEVAELVSGAPSGRVDHQGRDARKLHPDTARAGVVPRTKLVERLCAVEEARLVVVAAPAGYGKSTLLAQWLERDSRSGAWLTLDNYDNDPATLLTNIARSLRQAGLLSGDVQSEFRFTSATALSRGVWALVRSIDGATSGLLVLDQAESLRSRASRDVVAELAVRIPPTMTLAVASRSDIGLPVANLRSRGELLEVSASDLAMSGEEAVALAAYVGIDGRESVIDALVEHTEGWPVGLYLTMLTVKSGDPSRTWPQVRGDDRFLAGYMRGELLGRLSEKRASLLVRISILDDFSGPLCDFLLEREGSSRTLDSLASANLLIVPLDHRGWYRFHNLFREFLLAELQRREPEAVDSLHLRAAMWYEDHGIPDRAIHHAMAAGDQGRVARLVAASARVTFAEGRADTVLGWLAWFEEADRSARYPDICVLALLAHAHLGDAVLAQRYAATIGAAGERPAEVSPVARLARALMCGAGIERMHADAVEAQASLPPASEWHAAAVAAEGLALLWSGETEAADARLALAAEIGERFSAMPAAIFALATRSAIATKRGDHAEADALATRSLHLVRRVGLERYATSVLSFVVAARAARHRGDPAEARRLLSQASTLRPILTVVLPVIAIQSLLEMAEAEIELGDIAGARQLLREVADILNQRSGLGRLEDRFLEMRERLSSMPAGATTASTLTNAELRLLPLLVTHLSFPEIGERLYLSRHTVKTQAMSIYRKLGVSSRSEAVSAAREMHLLDI